MLFFVRNSLTSEVCASALSWRNNQSPFFHITGHLHLTFSLSHLKTSQQNFPTLWTICLPSSRETSHTFAIISGVVHVDGQPECLRSSTDSRPSLKHLNHSNVLAWLKACLPKASFSIWWVSAAVLLSLKQNLMQILCSLTSTISIADTPENGVKKTAKTRKHVHL